MHCYTLKGTSKGGAAAAAAATTVFFSPRNDTVHSDAAVERPHGCAFFSSFFSTVHFSMKVQFLMFARGTMKVWLANEAKLLL